MGFPLQAKAENQPKPAGPICLLDSTGFGHTPESSKYPVVLRVSCNSLTTKGRYLPWKTVLFLNMPVKRAFRVGGYRISGENSQLVGLFVLNRRASAWTKAIFPKQKKHVYQTISTWSKLGFCLLGWLAMAGSVFAPRGCSGPGAGARSPRRGARRARADLAGWIGAGGRRNFQTAEGGGGVGLGWVRLGFLGWVGLAWLGLAFLIGCLGSCLFACLAPHCEWRTFRRWHG